MLPCNRVDEVLIGVHDNNGHQGIDRTVARVNISIRSTVEIRILESI